MSNTVRYGTLNREYGMKMATMPPEDDGPVWMVNLMKYREVADYADGRESTISGRDADDAYSPLDSLAAVGAAPVFFGDVDQQLLGDEPKWDRIGVVKYPTRKSFIDMQSLPSFQNVAPPQGRGDGDHDCHRNPADAGARGAGGVRADRLGRRATPADRRGRPGRGDARHPLQRRGERRTRRRTTWSSTKLRRPRWRLATACASAAGLPWKTRSSATAGHGIRCGSTSSRAKRPSWPL